MYCLKPNILRISLILVITFTLFTNANICWGQHVEQAGERHKMAILFGYGGPNLNFVHLDIAYEYQIRILQVQYSYFFIKKRNFNLNLQIAPQFGFTRFKFHDTDPLEAHGVEMGLTAGISPEFHTRDDKFGVYLQINSGPTYISGGPERQSKGFNFSSYFLTGIKVKIQKRTFLELQSGFRHLSNARIKYPNGGINNLIINGGLAFTY